MNVKKTGLWFLLIGLCLIMSSCDIIIRIFGKLDVTLEAPDGTNVFSDGSIRLNAVVDSEDSLEYAWIIIDPVTEEEYETSATDEGIIYTAPLSGTERRIDLRVEVEADNGQKGSDTISLTIVPAASLRVENASGSAITGFYISPTTSTSWGSNILSSDIQTGYYSMIIGIPAGTYDIRAITGNNSVYTDLPAVFSNGVRAGANITVSGIGFDRDVNSSLAADKIGTILSAALTGTAVSFFRNAQ